MEKADTPKTPQPKFKINFFWLILIGWFLFTYHQIQSVQNETEAVPYSQFLSLLDQHTVKTVTIRGNEIEGTFISPLAGHKPHFATLKVDDPTLTQRLHDSGVQFEALPEGGFLKTLFSWIAPFFFMFFFWWLMMRKMGRSQGEVLSFGKSRAKVFVETDLKTRFPDVAGVDEAKAELQEVVEFLKDPKKYTRLGGRLPKGILLVGPPGVGKTLLARAVAGEAGVPFFSINGSEFVEMFVGLGAARVRDLFTQARSQKPCMIFIDELDALGKARGVNALTGASNDEKEQTLNQLLAELDGFDPSQGIVLLASTNRPEVLDPALLRSGRFDRQVAVDKPDRKGRIEILKLHMKKVTIGVDVNPEHIAGFTAGFSGADLENLVNEAALSATRRGAEKVESRDFTTAVERIVGGLERRSRILSLEERTRVAHHEMGHAAVSFARLKGETVHKVSIIPRGIGALGYTMKSPTEDRYLMQKDELLNRMAALLGGRGAEVVFFKEISTGAADDLDQVTEMARAMVMRYGMSERVGLLTYDRETSPLLHGAVTKAHDYSEETARLMDHEILSIVNRAYALALEDIKHYRGFILEGAQLLLDRETLDEHELKALWQKHTHVTLPLKAAL